MIKMIKMIKVIKHMRWILFEADLETELSFRTRLLDIMWGGLPVVTSRGNELSQLIEQSGSGFGVSDLDIEGISSALRALVADPVARAQMGVNARRCASEHFRWDEVVAPLARYCDAPRLAADSGGVAQRMGLSTYSRLDRLVRVARLRFKQKMTALGLFGPESA